MHFVFHCVEFIDGVSKNSLLLSQVEPESSNVFGKANL